jgi:hypothetical protein
MAAVETGDARCAEKEGAKGCLWRASGKWLMAEYARYDRRAASGSRG